VTCSIDFLPQIKSNTVSLQNCTHFCATYYHLLGVISQIHIIYSRSRWSSATGILLWFLHKHPELNYQIGITFYPTPFLRTAKGLLQLPKANTCTHLLLHLVSQVVDSDLEQNLPLLGVYFHRYGPPHSFPIALLFQAVFLPPHPPSPIHTSRECQRPFSNIHTPGPRYVKSKLSKFSRKALQSIMVFG
jgi:hypothetical protein